MNLTKFSCKLHNLLSPFAQQFLLLLADRNHYPELKHTPQLQISMSYYRVWFFYFCTLFLYIFLFIFDFEAGRFYMMINKSKLWVRVMVHAHIRKCSCMIIKYYSWAMVFGSSTLNLIGCLNFKSTRIIQMKSLVTALPTL